MLENLKNSGKMPLVIGIGSAAIAIIVITIAVIIGININKSKEANTDLSDITNQEEIPEDEQGDPIIIDQEFPDEETGEEQPDENPEKEPVEQPTKETPKVDPKYFIRVNYGANVVTIYTKDANGKYTVPYKAMVCSTGKATPRSGTYTMPSGNYSRGTWGMMIGNVWAQYFTRIKGSILFHSVPYTARNKWSLEYWEYDKLGTSASAGCVRLTVKNAKWIYDNCPSGTQVEFYSDSNPGPIVPEQPAKISEHEAVRGWDPTDPDKANPWKTYTPPQKEEIPENTPTTPSNPIDSTKPNDSTDEPTEPNTPSKPAEPEEPTTKPETPSKPSEPETPTENTKPTTPSAPTNPEDTTTPSNPTNPTTPDDSTNTQTKPNEPSKPSEETTTKPETPTTSPEADTPTENTQPTNPSTPSNPAEPTTPTTPSDPAEPTTPSEPSDEGKTTENTGKNG